MGSELVRRLRQTLGADVPTIMITGDISTEPGQNTGQEDYHVLHKPINDDLLFQTIQQLLSS